MKGDNLKLKLFLSLTLILFLPSVFSVSADTYFIDSNNHNPNGPFMIESPTAVYNEGIWYVIYESSDYHFYLAKSLDEGETWSKQKIIRSTHSLWPGWGTLRPSSLFIKDGVMYWVYPNATSYTASWVSLEYSSDFGETWSSVNRLSFHDNGIHNNIVDDGNKLFILEDDRGARYNTFDYSTKTSSGEVSLNCIAGQWGQISDVTKVENNKYVLCRKSGGGTNLIKIDEDYNQTTTQVFPTTYDHYEIVYDNSNNLSAIMKLGSEIYYSEYNSGTETFSDPIKISDSLSVSSRPTTTTNQENDILVLFTDTNSELYLIYYDLDSNTWFTPTKIQGISNASHPKFSFHFPPNKIADDFQILIDGNMYWGKFTSLEGLGINYFLDITNPNSGEQILQRNEMTIRFQVKDSNYNHTPVYEIEYKLDDSDEWTEKTITGYEWLFGFTVTAPNQTGEHTLTIKTLIINGQWISNSTNYEIIPREIDLKVNFIKAIQVIEDVNLVAGKKTAVKIGVSSNSNAKQPIKIRLEFNDQNYYQNGTLIGDDNFIFYETENTPYTEAGDYTITAEVQPKNNTEETDESNNYKSETVTVKEVRELDVVFRPVGFDNAHYTYTGKDEFLSKNYYITNTAVYEDDIERMSNFLFSSFPLKKLNSYYDDYKVYCLDPSCTTDINYQNDGNTLKIISELDREYLLTGDRWYSNLLGREFRTVGISPKDSVKQGLAYRWDANFLSRKFTVLVEHQTTSVMAHEIGHTIWHDNNSLCDEYRDTSGESYCANPSPPNCNCGGGGADCYGSIINTGIWIENKEEFSSVDSDVCNSNNTFSFMGSSNYLPPERWATYNEYQHIFSAFENAGWKSGGSDVNILLVSGLVDIDLNIELDEFYILEGQEFGSSDGNCAIRTTDINGLKLNDYNFAVSFIMHTNPPTDTNYSSFILGIPFDENINSVQAICNGELKAERFVSDNAPTVSITSPSGSEEWSGDNLIEWSGNDLDEDDLEFVLQYSEDNGLTWNPLGMHVTDENFTFDVGMVDGNTSYKIKVIATDGVLTGEDVSATFSIMNPNIDIIPNEWNLGTINELQNVSQDFNIVNSGNADLNVFDVNYSEDLNVTNLNLPIVLQPGEDHVFSVELKVLDMNLGEFNKDINLGSNDPNQIVEQIKIYGEIEEAKPDFRITEDNITFNPVYPDENQNVTVNALVENLGDLNASDVNVSFYYSGGFSDSTSFLSIAPLVDVYTVGLYNADSNSGTTLIDETGNHNGSFKGEGEPAWTENSKFGVSALSFDGVDDYVSVPDSNELDLTNELSVELWFYFDDSAAWQGLIAKRNEETDKTTNYGLNTNGTTMQWYFRETGAGSWDILSFSAPSRYNWHHFMGTFKQINPTTVKAKAYIDGVLQAESNLSGNLNNTLNSHDLIIGSSAINKEPFDGLIDEIKISNKVKVPLDLNLISTETISFIDANSSELISTQLNDVNAGNHEIMVIIDTNNFFNEKNKENNYDFNSFTVYSEPELSVEFEYSPLQDLGEVFDLNAIIENTGAKLINANAELILPEELTTTDSLTKTIGDLNSHTSTKIEWQDINSSEAGLFEMIVNIKGSNADENFSAFASIRHIELSELDVNEFIYPDENVGDFNVINFNPDITYTGLYYAVDITGPENYSYDKNLNSLYAGQTKPVTIEWSAWKQTGSYNVTVSLYDYYDELIDQKQDSFEVIGYVPSMLTYYSTDGLTFDPEFSSYSDYFSSAGDKNNQVMVVYGFNGDMNYSIRNPIAQEWSAPQTIGTGSFPYLVGDGNDFHLVYVDGNVYYRKYSSGWGSAELVTEMSSVDPVITIDGSRLYALFSSEVNGLFNVYLSGFDGNWNTERKLTYCVDANCSNPSVLDEDLVDGKLAYGYRKFKGEEYSTLDSNLMYSLYDVNYFYWGNN